MLRTLPWLSALAIVLGNGLVQGRWADRAATTRALADATARLRNVPKTVGAWQGSETAMDRNGLEQAGIEGLVARRYENARTGAVVAVLLVCGRPGPIAVHGPEVCYAGAGYDRHTTPVRRALPGSPGDEFWVSDFQDRAQPLAATLRIFWSWSASGAWRAAEGPRIQFASETVIYKLYMIVENADDGAGGDPCPEFAGVFLPALRRSLFPRP